MDSLFEALSEFLIQTFDLEPAVLMGVLALISMIARLIGKSIPDETTGVLGVIRKIAKVIGLYVSNRLTPGTTTNSIARQSAGLRGK